MSAAATCVLHPRLLPAAVRTRPLLPRAGVEAGSASGRLLPLAARVVSRPDLPESSDEPADALSPDEHAYDGKWTVLRLEKALRTLGIAVSRRRHQRRPNKSLLAAALRDAAERVPARQSTLRAILADCFLARKRRGAGLEAPATFAKLAARTRDAGMSLPQGATHTGLFMRLNKAAEEAPEELLTRALGEAGLEALPDAGSSKHTACQACWARSRLAAATPGEPPLCVTCRLVQPPAMPPPLPPEAPPPPPQAISVEQYLRIKRSAAGLIAEFGEEVVSQEAAQLLREEGRVAEAAIIERLLRAKEAFQRQELDE